MDKIIPHNGLHASIGVVFQDSNTEWLSGYSMSLGKKSVFKVEVRTMVEDLFIAQEKGFKKIEIKCDIALLVELLLVGGGTNSRLVE